MAALSLPAWEANGWLRPHRITAEELSQQLRAAKADLVDASADISPAWRFAIAYNAALRLCSAVLAAAGYRAAREQKHYRTIAAMSLILGNGVSDLTRFLDTCRTKRHEVTYESASPISESEADELVEAVRELERTTVSWLRRVHPGLLPG